MSSISYDDIVTAVCELRQTMGTPPPNLIKPIISPHASVHDGYNFPPSRHRSKRVLKKLLKRFGQQEKPRIPASFVMGGKLVMHPTIYAEFARTLAANFERRFDDQLSEIMA